MFGYRVQEEDREAQGRSNVGLRVWDGGPWGRDQMNYQFAQWVTGKADAIAEARGVSVEDVATEPGEITVQIARARKNYVVMGVLKADASSWVNKTRAMALVKVKDTTTGFSADERKILADADDDYLKALRIKGEIAVTATALRSMAFEIRDERKSYAPSHIDNDD